MTSKFISLTAGDDTWPAGEANQRNDAVLGLGGDDTLDGGRGNDILDGGAGADRLFGGSGNDYLAGGAGNDELSGGAGNDKLTGGEGEDVFVFGAEGIAGDSDKITDFEVGVDYLQLEDGLSVERVDLKDFNHDGADDGTVIFLSNDTTISLLGVTELDSGLLLV